MKNHICRLESFYQRKYGMAQLCNFHAYTFNFSAIILIICCPHFSKECLTYPQRHRPLLMYHTILFRKGSRFEAATPCPGDASVPGVILQHFERRSGKAQVPYLQHGHAIVFRCKNKLSSNFRVPGHSRASHLQKT